MRHLGTATGLALATVLLTGAAGLGVAAADDDVPSREQVEDARTAVRSAASSVDEAQARLAVANAGLDAATVRAAQAAEAYNGARWRAEEARRAERAARAASTQAAADQEALRQRYADLLVSSYQAAPELSALGAILDADGLSSALEAGAALDAGHDALDARYDELRAATAVTSVSATRAEDARDAADQAAADAEDARDAAAEAADAAAAEASAVAAERTRLIGDLARLQDISVDLAARRQEGLEERAREAAEAAAEAAAKAAEEAQAKAAAEEAQEQATEEAQQPVEETAEEPAEDAAEEPAEEPAPPAADPTPPPAAAGAAAAIAFARAQIGEPYRWAAAGPSAWDCSGLTMGAWAAGGKSLPHYSVAQYEQSTPISPSDLRPGDLVFWGDSSSPSSIYHVALYAGDGMIIHAPRTGRPVTEESMYYWITPNFYARP